MANFISDGTAEFTGGQDAYHSPDRIRPDSYAKGVNISTRRGVLGPRHGFEKIDIQFDDETIETKYRYTRSIKDVFQAGKFQAIAPYFINPEFYLIIVVSGLFFKFNTRTRRLSLMSKTVRANQYARRINWSAAGKYLVFFDYPDYPLIIENDIVRRANPNNVNGTNKQPEVPISTVGAYLQNRLFVGNAGVEWTGGDPVGNLATPKAPITFTEVLEPFQSFTGQVFSLTTNNVGEPITAMGFIQNIDTSTGIGPLFVATRNAVYYYRVDQPRSQWENSQFGTVLLFNTGVAGPRAFANVNSDLVFVSGEGKVHAISTARNDAQRWGNVPISREVENYLTFTDDSLKELSFVGYFDNHIYVSANPYRVTARDLNNQPVPDYAHGGMVVLTMDNIAALNTQGNPIWDGLYTAKYLRPMDMVTTADKRSFIISKDSAVLNNLYELTPDRTYDVIDGKERPIKSIIYTREFDFKNREIQKHERLVNIPLYDIQGALKIDIDRRPGHFARFVKFSSFKHTAPYRQCDPLPDKPNGLAGHYFRNIIFGAPTVDENECDPVTKDTLQYFRTIQYRISIEARNWQIRELLLEAVPVDEYQSDNSFDTYEPAEIPNQCDSDWIASVDSGCENDATN